MKKILDRRAALRLFSAGSAALASSAALAASAGSSAATVAENPELLELGRKWDEAFATFETASSAFEEARADYFAARLDVPADLFMTAGETLVLSAGSLTDHTGVHLHHPTQGFRRILTVGTIEADLPDFNGRTKIGKRLLGAPCRSRGNTRRKCARLTNERRLKIWKSVAINPPLHWSI
ncbi:hypothetical protein [Rhodoblastus sp.]|uniref:hypothetical protein n=1 Tax=Rhodoblastus sp. TaxID=1962975 RepID=UPI003F972C2E